MQSNFNQHKRPKKGQYVLLDLILKFVFDIA